MFSSVQCQPLLVLWSADHRINLMYQVLHRSQFLSEIRHYSFSTATFFSSEYINFITVSSFDNILFVHQHHMSVSKQLTQETEIYDSSLYKLQIS